MQTSLSLSIPKAGGSKRKLLSVALFTARPETFRNLVKRYTFKISPFEATLFREYDRSIFNTPSHDIDPLSIGQAVRFYVFKDDYIKLHQPAEKVTFFNLKNHETFEQLKALKMQTETFLKSDTPEEPKP